MRRLRFLIAIPAIAGLAIMGATGASAAPAHQAAHARTMTATSSGADPKIENENGLWIDGSTHNTDLIGTTDPHAATSYTITYSGKPGLYIYSVDGLCWNSLGAAGGQIAPESCPSGDLSRVVHEPRQ
jgi:hypothetical protein